jgi:hypothetical protein
MGQARTPIPVLLVVAISSNDTAALEWGAAKVAQAWGAVWLKTPIFAFDHTSFYRSTMGEGIKKQLIAFEQPIDPADLAKIKNQSNAIEREYERLGDYDVERPINIDPGYVTEAKLVLATIKDRDHRVYLSDGIYGEVTLSYYGKKWNASRWTYPDYMTSENLEFVEKCRLRLREKLQVMRAEGTSR